MSAVINLEDYRTKGSKVFTGRDRGEDVRKRTQIDYLEGKNDKIEIIVPQDIYSINPSFLEELLVNVVRRLNKDRFFDKFIFTSKGPYQINNDLEEAVDRILRKKTALS